MIIQILLRDYGAYLTPDEAMMLLERVAQGSGGNESYWFQNNREFVKNLLIRRYRDERLKYILTSDDGIGTYFEQNNNDE